MSTRTPTIFVFSNVEGGREGPCIALAEDGTVLGSHWCSGEYFASMDLGVEPGTRPDRHEKYAAHYPQGYVMEFVPSAAAGQHVGLLDAIKAHAASQPPGAATAKGGE